MSFDSIRSLFNDLGKEIEIMFQIHQDRINILANELDKEQQRNKKLKQLLYNFLEDDLNE